MSSHQKRTQPSASGFEMLLRGWAGNRLYGACRGAAVLVQATQGGVRPRWQQWRHCRACREWSALMVGLLEFLIYSSPCAWVCILVRDRPTPAEETFWKFLGCLGQGSGWE